MNQHFSMTDSLAAGVLKQMHKELREESIQHLGNMIDMSKTKTGPRYREMKEKVQAYVKNRKIFELKNPNDNSKTPDHVFYSWGALTQHSAEYKLHPNCYFVVEAIEVTEKAAKAGFPFINTLRMRISAHVVRRVLFRMKTIDFRDVMEVLNSAIVSMLMSKYLASLPVGQFAVGVPGGLVIGHIDVDNTITFVTFIHDGQLRPQQQHLKSDIHRIDELSPEYGIITDKPLQLWLPAFELMPEEYGMQHLINESMS